MAPSDRCLGEGQAPASVAFKCELNHGVCPICNWIVRLVAGLVPSHNSH